MKSTANYLSFLALAGAYGWLMRLCGFENSGLPLRYPAITGCAVITLFMCWCWVLNPLYKAIWTNTREAPTQVRKLYREVRQQDRIDALSAQVAYLEHSMRQGSGRGASITDRKLLNALIQFCHPDKHYGSERAMRLTQALLKLRGDP